jgi:hypothetical protein
MAFGGVTLAEDDRAELARFAREVQDGIAAAGRVAADFVAGYALSLEAIRGASLLCALGTDFERQIAALRAATLMPLGDLIEPGLAWRAAQELARSRVSAGEAFGHLAALNTELARPDPTEVVTELDTIG